MKWLNVITLMLLIIGGLNWGLVAIGGHDMDAVAIMLRSADHPVARLIYALVGLAGLWQLMPWFKTLRMSETEAEANRHEMRPTPSA
jgi:uncharacterized membrane protein YuzA (DUF378 family)